MEVLEDPPVDHVGLDSLAPSAPSVTSKRYVCLPLAVLNDPRLTDTAKIIYAIMLDAYGDRGKLIAISLNRIGERLGRRKRGGQKKETGRYTVKPAIEELVAAGHLRAFPGERGKCTRYQLMTLPPIKGNASTSGCPEPSTPARVGSVTSNTLQTGRLEPPGVVVQTNMEVDGSDQHNLTVSSLTVISQPHLGARAPEKKPKPEDIIVEALVSEGCDQRYAEGLAFDLRKRWGVDAERFVFELAQRDTSLPIEQRIQAAKAATRDTAWSAA